MNKKTVIIILVVTLLVILALVVFSLNMPVYNIVNVIQ